MRYFPLTSDQFKHDFGIRPLSTGESIIERTDRYVEQVRLRQESLADEFDQYFQALPDSKAAQREASKLVFDHAPFLHREISLEKCDDSPTPLAEIGKQVQEDLVILCGDAGKDFPVIAGVVCFPSGWSVVDKLSKSITQVHAPVPEYETQFADQTGRLMSRLKTGRPVWRMNWGIRPSDQLDQSPRHQAWLLGQQELVTSENVGERCYFRVERQTLSRLPMSNAILFTIHTHQCPLNELDPVQRKRLLGVLSSCPEETLRYKGILVMAAAIKNFLQGTM